MTFEKGLKSEFVGREREFTDLKSMLDEASNSKGQLALISGEAGIGKTRLVSELKRHAVSNNFRCLEGACVYHEVSDPYLPFIGALSDITTPSFIDDSQKFVMIEEAFLISNTGNVISHAARIGASILDEHIVGAMLSAVETFVKDAFGDGETSTKGLETLEYGNIGIIIEHGKFVFLVVVLSGVEPEGIREDIRKLVRKIEDKYYDILKDWDGNLAKVKDITHIIKGLTTVKYRIRQAIRDIDIKKEKDRVFEKVLQIIIEASKEDPILLILEDIHWADNSSLQLLQYVARNTKESRVLICCTYRPEELDDVEGKRIHPLKGAIQRMSRYKMFETVELNRLYKEETFEMLKTLLGSQDLPDIFVDRIYKETEGNPFFIEEILHSLIDEEIIRFEDGIWQIGEVSEIHIPSTIKDIVMLRIERLDDKLLNALKYASVIGQEFNYNILSLTQEINEEDLVTALERLEEKKLVKVISPDDEIYRFNHAMIQEVVYNSLSRQRTRMIHGKVAIAIEELNKDNLVDVVFQLVYHYSNTKDYDKALEYSIKAGDKASSQFAMDEALKYCQLALDAIEHIDETIENKRKKLRITNHLGDICFVIGEWDEALRYYGISKILSEELKDEKRRAESYRNIGLINSNKNEWEIALKNLETALKTSEGVKDYHGIADSYYYLGTIFERKGEFQDALKSYGKCMENATNIGDSHEVARAYLGVGKVYAQKGQYKDSIDCFKKVVEILEEKEDLSELSKAYVNLGSSYIFINIDEAIKYHKKAIELANKTGNIRMKGHGLINIAYAYLKKRELNKSHCYLDEALKIFTKLGERMAISSIYTNYGSIFKLQNEWDKAKEYYEKAMSICNELDTPYYLGDVLYEYGLMYKQKGDKKEARLKFTESLNIFKNLQNKEMIEKVEKELSTLL